MALFRCGGGAGAPTETTLWTNSAPSTAFLTTTVTLSDDITNYDYIKVVGNSSTSDTKKTYAMISVDDFLLTASTVQPIIIQGDVSTTRGARSVQYATNTTVLIDDAYAVGGSGKNNGAAIPVQIIGIKY